MTVFYEASALPNNSPKPLALTIGMFDGIHLGHQKVLETAKTIANEKQTQLLCITFSNNPKAILQPNKKVNSIYSLEHKIELLKSYGADLILIEPFTQELANQTSFNFLNAIYQKCPFSDLILGYNATLGKDQSNNREQVIAACKTLNVATHYVDKVLIEGHPVSSSLIRNYISVGEITKAEQLLGRTYNERD